MKLPFAVVLSTFLLYCTSLHSQGVLLPQTKYYLYVEKGDYGVLRCQNKNGSPITDAQWYRIFPNGTKQQFGNSTSDPVYVQSYILNFRPSVRQEDQGVYYCCKPNGSCNENFTVTIADPPAVEVTKSDYVSTIGSSVTLTCRITKQGAPMADFGWIRNGRWLPSDSVNSTHFSLTLTNLTNADGGRYTCAAQGVLILQERNVALIINDPPEVTIYGPTEVDFGSIVSIGCTVLKGNPTPSVFIITPQERIINESMITFNATIKDAGVYTCVANNSEATVTRNLSLTVYVAPRPVKSRQWITITAGADLALPCIVEMANPPPLYHWQHIVPHEDDVVGNFQPLENGSLLLTGVKASAIYECNAWNEYGTSIHFIYITIDNQQVTNTTLMFLITDPTGNCYHDRSEGFKTAISAALEEYIQEICNCTVVLTNANLICINATSAFYTVQLTNQNSTIPAFIFEPLDFIIMNNGIDLGIAIIHTWTTREEIHNDGDDIDNGAGSDINATNWHILLYLLFPMLFTFINY